MIDLLKPHETNLVGQWVLTGNQVKRDATAERIYELSEKHLQYLASTDGGWSKLFRDPSDNRFWELTYPNSGWQGGGPPALSFLDPASAVARYDIQP